MNWQLGIFAGQLPLQEYFFFFNKHKKELYLVVDTMKKVDEVKSLTQR